MKPWERYTKTSAPAQQGPWSKYQDNTGALNKYMDTLSPEQTQPEWLSTGDRMIAKNFAQSVPKQVEYLKSQYPDKEFTLNANGQVLAKSKGDAKWQVMDPDTGMFSSDFLKDVGDIGSDIATGVATSAAGTAGAVGGALSPVPGGTIAGASAASGATGAGLEALRQGIGKLLGVPQDISGSDVLQAGVVNAVSPVLFGAGGATSNQIAKLAASKGISVEAAKELFDSQSRGLIKRGVDAVLPRLGSMATGISVDNIKNYAKHSNEIDDLAQGGQGGILSYTENLTNKVNDTLNKRTTELGKNVARAVENAGQSVDISKAKKAFQDRIAFLESKPNITNAERAEINSLKGAYTKYFGLATPEKPSLDVVNADPELQKMFAHLDTLNSSRAPVTAKPADLTSTLVEGTTAKPGMTYQPEQDAFLADVNKYVNNGVDSSVDALDAEAKKLANEYNMSQQNQFKEQNQSAIKELMARIKAKQDELVNKGTVSELPDKIDAGRSFDLQKKLKQSAAFEGELTPENLSARGSARNAYGAINEGLDAATSGTSTEAKNAYATMMDIDNELLPKFSSADKTYQTVSNMDKKGKLMLKERLKKAANDGLLDIGKEQDIIRAYNAFKDPATQANGTGLMTVLGTLGSLAGYKAGGGYGAAAAGGMGGAAAGKALSSQRAMEWLTKKAIKANAASNPTSRALTVTTPNTILDWLKQRELEQQLTEQNYSPRY